MQKSWEHYLVKEYRERNKDYQYPWSLFIRHPKRFIKHLEVGRWNQYERINKSA